MFFALFFFFVFCFEVFGPTCFITTAVVDWGRSTLRTKMFLGVTSLADVVYRT